MIKLIFLLITISITGCATVDNRTNQSINQSSPQCLEIDVLKMAREYKYENYDAEEIANVYLPFGVASLNTYSGHRKSTSSKEMLGVDKKFTLKQYSNEWKLQPRGDYSGGLVLDYYINEPKSNQFILLIAFRGTDFTSPADWFANFSWITGFIPIKDQYDLARDAVDKIIKKHVSANPNIKYSIITTGHSLGGGLAQHIAYAFPCTSAVVFNSSFVVNLHRLKEPYRDAQVVFVSERNDELTFLGKIFPDAPHTKSYAINPLPIGRFQHELEPLVVGMARMVADCQTDTKRNNPPGCSKSDERARKLYCESDYAKGEKLSPICAIKIK